MCAVLGMSRQFNKKFDWSDYRGAVRRSDPPKPQTT